MAGDSLDHSAIGLNVGRLLQDALEGRPCWVYNGNAATRLSPRRYTFPDASVTCDPRDRGRVTEVQSPRLIVEVLSDTTEAYDRGDKFRHYRACPSVQEYVLIATKRQAVQVYRRTAQGWTAYQAYGPDDMAQLASLDVHLPVSALYCHSEYPRTWTSQRAKSRPRRRASPSPVTLI